LADICPRDCKGRMAQVTRDGKGRVVDKGWWGLSGHP
jgi:hypothetical protein